MWNEDGTITLTNGVFQGDDIWEQARAADRLVRSDDLDAFSLSLKNMLEACIHKGGYVEATADLPMGGQKHLNVDEGSMRNHYAALSQLQDDKVAYLPSTAVGGTANAITLTPTPEISAYAAGQRFRFKPSAVPTEDVTVNVSDAGAQELHDANGRVGADGLNVGLIYEVVYDGTKFLIVGGPIGAAARYAVGAEAGQLVPLNSDGRFPSSAIPAQAANDFNIHDDIATEMESPEDADRLAVSAESVDDAPMRYLPLTTLKDYIATGHSHAAYAADDHSHTAYAADDHSHTAYAGQNHSHSSVASHGHNYSRPGHGHSYAAPTHTHNYAGPSHTHTHSHSQLHTHPAPEPCFPLWAPILMADGSWRPLREVKPGARVMSPDGPREVVALDYHHSCPGRLSRITVCVDGVQHSVVSTPNHAFWLADGGWAAVRPNYQSRSRLYRAIIDPEGHTALWSKGTRGKKKTLTVGDQLVYQGRAVPVTNIAMEDHDGGAVVTPVTGGIVIVAGGFHASGYYDPATVRMKDPRRIREFLEVKDARQCAA